MNITMLRRPFAVALAIALLAIALPATAAITPESDVLLPWFEIDLERSDLGLATTFTLVNAAPTAVNARVVVYTNWGIPVLEVPVSFDPSEAKTIDLRAWIVEGKLPGNVLTPIELAHVRAALTGRSSPRDGLFYGSAVEEGVAVGYVTAQTLGERNDSLFGDTYTIDAASNYFAAETLTALTHDLKGDCSRHGIRFVNQDRLFEGTELIIWSGRRFQPSPTPTPGGSKMKITVGVYDQAGKHVQDCLRELVAVERLMVCQLDITPPIGWLQIATEDPTVILQHLHSTTRASAQVHSYCLRGETQVTGAAIALKKNINGHEADQPPGPKFAAGDQVPFEFHVTNTGSVELTGVTVTDDAGLQVSCPKSALGAGESMTCTATGTAEGCINLNIATATGTTAGGTRVSATDVAYYTGIYAPALELKTLVNGDDANDPAGPVVDTGELLHWTFVVTNNGNTRLNEIAVATGSGLAAACPKTSLDPQESMTCSAESPAKEGQQQEVGKATGVEHCGSLVEATDPAYYTGRLNAPSIAIEKLIGENEADTPPGPTLPLGVDIKWQFIVTNTGNVPLTGIAVTDDHGLVVTCVKTALDPGEATTCFAGSLSLPCQQSNTATVTATAGTQTVTASDAAHYFGETHPALTVEMKINGDAADDPPGAWIDENTIAQVTYEVVNSGDVELTGITVTDDGAHVIECPTTTLQAGQSMSCGSNEVTTAGAHAFTATVSGQPPCGDAVQATDLAYYRGKALIADLTLVKGINGQPASAPPGPAIPIGFTISWTYIVTNTGTLPLSGIVVTDSDGFAVTCPKTTLEPGESMTCTASSAALPCQQSNTATASGTAEQTQGTATVTDVAFYFGEGHPAVTLELSVNGDEADAPPGPVIGESTPVLLTYVVTNNGDVELTGLAVSDDHDRPALCPKTTLQAGESMTCTASFLAVAGSWEITGSVYGNPPCGDRLQANDPAFYKGLVMNPGIELWKATNGIHSGTAPGPTLPVGSSVQWTYVVTNTGDVVLTNVGVQDSGGVTVTCPKTALEPGESMTCTASGVAVACQYTNSATATGQPPAGTPVTATDQSFYFGEHHAAVSFEKLLNGYRHPTPPGPTIMAGATIYWSFLVTNTGDVALTGVTVTDSHVSAVTCPKTTLDPGESMTCTASSPAVRGQQQNTASVTAQPPCGDAVSANDSAWYIAVAPGIAFEKLVNGNDADDPQQALHLWTLDPVLWTFVVTNSGDLPLHNVFVTDNRGVTVTCPKTSLAPGESMTCTASGVAEAGSYCNTATASGTTPQDLTITASDSACYFAVDP